MPETMTKEQRAELRKLAEAATPGPWTAEPHFETTALYSGRTGGNPFGGCHRLRLLNLDDGDWNFAPNRDYITAANPEATLSLLDALDAAEAEAGRLREVVERYKKAAEKAMPELSAMYNQLTGERLMRADPQHAVLIAYKMLEAARAAQGAPGGAGQ